MYFLPLFLFSINVFAQVDVPRETRAVTYPVDETVMLKFRGTTRFPRMKGEGKIQRTKRTVRKSRFPCRKCRAPLNSALVSQLMSCGRFRLTDKLIIWAK
ncbi:MAG: hypothetical protein WKF71_08450 [Pyrinomonadaceae bacterium]